MKVFTTIPFFRICIPLVAGIIPAIQFGWSPVNGFVLGLVFLLSVLLAWKTMQGSLNKIALLICLDVFLFCFGINLVSKTRITNSPAYYGNSISGDSLNKLMVVVNDLPVEKEKFYKCELRVLEVEKGKEFVQTKGILIGYLKKSTVTAGIRYGQTLLINTKLLPVDPPKNPFEFDYHQYLSNRQILHTCFIDSVSYVAIEAPSQLSFIWEAGLKAKQYVLHQLKNSELSKQAYAICAALLTGYDDDIDKPVMEAFSHTGTLHVLSVSGLHTGLIYLALAFLFDLADRKKKRPLLKFLFITFCLWFFALLTGFSAPVLRAVIMFNLLGLGKIFFKNSVQNQINILFVSAFILLCYNPFLIMDIGFQLSYFALFGILFFQPIFQGIWEPENKILNYLWQNISASFAATLTTLPFTLFYFKQFPLWFFVCNLVVVPLTFLILLLGVLLVLKMGKIALLINLVVQFLLWFIQLFGSSDIGYIDNIHFTFVDGVILTLLIIFISVSFYKRSYKWLVYSFLLIITWQLNGIFSSWLAKTETNFVVYHAKKESVYGLKNKTTVQMDSVSKATYNYHVRPHHISFNYPGVSTNGFNFVAYKDQTILILNKKNHWPQISYKDVSVLVIANNFKLTENNLEEFSGLKTVVADGSNNSYVVKQLAGICSKFGLAFYSTKEKGAYILQL